MKQADEYVGTLDFMLSFGDSGHGATTVLDKAVSFQHKGLVITYDLTISAGMHAERQQEGLPGRGPDFAVN